MLTKKRYLHSVLGILFIDQSYAEEQYGHLETHRPVYVGYTQDDDDVPFVDFQLSMKYPVLHSGQPKESVFGFLPNPYLLFTGRFGMYMHTRYSSPVLAKHYNPELSGRYWLNWEEGKRDSLDLIIGHESNGQSIATEDSYLEQQTFLEEEDGDAKYADDYISRGWDYVGILWSQHWQGESEHNQLTTYFRIHSYLESGIVQKSPEEYHSWENDSEGKPRSYVDGINISLKKSISFGGNFITREKLFFQYTTGIENSFEYHSLRAEFGLTLGNLPIMLWAHHGYNSDFADYYKKANSFGISLILTDY